MRYLVLLVTAITALAAAFPSNGCGDECVLTHATCLNDQSTLECYNKTCSSNNEKCKNCPFCLARVRPQIHDADDSEHPRSQVSSANVDNIESSQVCLKDCYKDGKLQCLTKMCKMCEDCRHRTAVDARSDEFSAYADRRKICLDACYKNGKADCKVKWCRHCKDCGRRDSQFEVSPVKHGGLEQCAGMCTFFKRCTNDACRAFVCEQDKCHKCSYCVL